MHKTFKNMELNSPSLITLVIANFTTFYLTHFNKEEKDIFLRFK